jgi:hypothetical protein
MSKASLCASLGGFGTAIWANTGTTDFAQIAVPNPPSEAHKLAFDIFVDRIQGYTI